MTPDGHRRDGPRSGRQPRLIVVAGPTGTGKSDLALDLAERLDGEIVNADSMQLYRGMDIGTAKVPVAERRGIPHHLLDVLEVTEIGDRRPLSAGRQGRDRATSWAADRTPILVGGSGLYIQSVVDEIEFPATDPQRPRPAGGRAGRLGHRHCSGCSTSGTRPPPSRSDRPTAARSSARSRSSR